jgi:hypothetical protein
LILFRRLFRDKHCMPSRLRCSTYFRSALRVQAPYPADLRQLLTCFPEQEKKENQRLLPVDGEKRIDYH